MGIRQSRFFGGNKAGPETLVWSNEACTLLKSQSGRGKARTPSAETLTSGAAALPLVNMMSQHTISRKMPRKTMGL